MDDLGIDPIAAQGKADGAAWADNATHARITDLRNAVVASFTLEPPITSLRNLDIWHSIPVDER